MSKVGKKSITVPAGVTVHIEGSRVTVKGARGELSREFPPGFTFELEGNQLKVIPPAKMQKQTAALWGTARANIANMVEGVIQGFTKVLEFEGIGFRAEATATELTIFAGYSHPVKMAIPQGLTVATTKNSITISGQDTIAVGQFAARVRKVRLPEPYKGSGIRYQGEVIKRKAGKKLAGAAGS